MGRNSQRAGVRPALASVSVVALVVASGMVLWSGAPVTAVRAYGSSTGANTVTVVASSLGDQFVGAVGGKSSLFVGSLNGTVAKMDPLTGHLMGSVALPDGNSAAHLTYYYGYLYVGTEWLPFAKDKAPFHVYKIDPNTMKIVAQVPMESYFANGFVLAFNGYLWAGDGHCTLYKIDANSLTVVGKVPGMAEDEMTFDGANYWAECVNTVNVLKPSAGLPYLIASRTLPSPNRPRGFFTANAVLYSSGSSDYTVYSMSLSGTSVALRSATKVSGTIPTRDTLQYGGLVYAYETGPRADSGQLPARIFVYGRDFGLVDVVPLPGPALSLDASQHSLFTFNGRLYFVTQSAIGYVDTVHVSASSTMGGPSIRTATQAYYHQDVNIRKPMPVTP
jgi:hypothetical protein